MRFRPFPFRLSLSLLNGLLALLLAVVMFANTSAFARARSVRAPDDEADLDDSSAGAILSQVVDRLARQIEVLPDNVFPVIPSDWNRARITAALKKIRTKPEEKRVRAHRSLMFDHDVKTQSLVALRPFFLLYGLVPNAGNLSRDQLRDLDRKLLVEVAELWKATPKNADTFADQMLTLFDRDVIFCRGEVKMSSPIIYHFIVNPAWLEGGVLVTSPQWAINTDAPSYKEMADHGVNSELYRSVISRGLGDNSVVNVEKSSSEIKVNFKLTKIGYQLDSGKGTFVDIDQNSHAIDCHNTLSDTEAAKTRAPQTDAKAKATPTPAPAPKPTDTPKATASPKPSASPAAPGAEVPKPPSAG